MKKQDSIKKEKTTIFDVINITLLSVVAFSMLYPFVYLLFVSVSPIEEILKSDIFLFPTKFTLESYQYVFSNEQLGRSYLVTIFVTVVGTVINLAMTACAAYVVSQKHVPGRNFFMWMIMVTMFFNGGLIPFFIVVSGIGLYDSLWALIIPTAINTFWMIIMRNFFSSIPTSLSESARIDGASEYRILLTIIFPLSGPIFATLALFYGVAHWNEYFHSIIFLNNPMKVPLQVLVRSMYQSAISSTSQEFALPPVETLRAATVMVVTVPILCLYPFLQKYFVQGIMVGAIKG